VVKYAEAEWVRKQLFLPEDRILINPLDPVYKSMLENAHYEEGEIIPEIKKRLSAVRSDSEDTKSSTPSDIDPSKEVLYQLFPLVSVARKGSHSREAGLAIKMVTEPVRERLWFALDNEMIRADVLDTMKGISTLAFLSKITVDIPREDVFRLVPRGDSLQYAVRWTDVADSDLTQYYIVEGWIPLTKAQLIEVYTDLLTKALKAYIDEKREEYRTQNYKLPQIFTKILTLISSEVPAVSVAPVGAAEFDEQAFPPCIREALQGTFSGLRNYAITVLLTAFLSYARVYPSLTAFDQEKKPELSPEQIEIILEEVAPVIIEAGNKCDPPLFQDQPIEQANVFYHLGFGLSDSPFPRDFGASKWYLPPSCVKVKQNAPSLCKPDTLCLQGIYAVADRTRLEELINSNTGEAQRVLSALKKTRNPQRIAEASQVDIGEVKRILRNLHRDNVLVLLQVKNPLVYYVRKIRRKKRGQR
jgi:DNA primase large subunit